MQLLRTSSSHPSDQLAVLGAGNCNDLDLSALLDRYQQVSLVDIDAQACETAVCNQLNQMSPERVSIVAPHDVSGLFDLLDHLSTVHASELRKLDLTDRILQSLSAHQQTAVPHGPHQCVFSSCLLSQLIDAVVMTIGSDQPRLPEIIQAVRQQHLLYMINSLAPAGRGVLVFDFLSSQTLPQLMKIPDQQLTATLQQAIASRNFFTGLNPFVLHHILSTNDLFCGRIDTVRLTTPWRWSIGSKQFAVAAITFRRCP
jgi:hypothetical protein